MNSQLEQDIVRLIFEQFNSLPAKCKPRTLANGQREWVPMSAIVLSQSTSTQTSDRVKIISIATGAKSLPVSALTWCEGLVLHDCHAEILAIRGFNQWLLREIEHMLRHSEYVSPWLAHNFNTKEPPFHLKRSVEILMYASEAPCGDASMELLMAANASAGKDVEPWTADGSNSKLLPPGRGNFADLGKLRRKPARADAEISMSKSCSDKLMLKQFTGLLSTPVRQLLCSDQATFLKRLIVHADRYHAVGYERAFAAHGRLLAVPQETISQARFFNVVPLSLSCPRFEFEKSISQGGSKVSNLSAIWLAGVGNGQPVVEALVNGVKQGFKQFDARPAKASVLSRKRMLELGLAIEALLLKSNVVPRTSSLLIGTDYHSIKLAALSAKQGSRKQLVLNRLGGWPHIEDKDKDNFVVMPQLKV